MAAQGDGYGFVSLTRGILSWVMCDYLGHECNTFHQITTTWHRVPYICTRSPFDCIGKMIRFWGSNISSVGCNNELKLFSKSSSLINLYQMMKSACLRIRQRSIKLTSLLSKWSSTGGDVISKVRTSCCNQNDVYYWSTRYKHYFRVFDCERQRASVIYFWCFECVSLICLWYLTFVCDIKYPTSCTF